MVVKQTVTKAAIRKKIVAFLDRTAASPDDQTGTYHCGMVHRNALVLATSYNDMPRATALEFFHEDVIIYILGVPGGKVANIRRNQNVSAFIYEQPMDHAVKQQSLQLFGTAELITSTQRPRLFKNKLNRYNMQAVMTKLLGPIAAEKGLQGLEARNFIDKFIAGCSFIRITPHHLILKEYYPDFSMQKFEWRR